MTTKIWATAGAIMCVASLISWELPSVLAQPPDEQSYGESELSQKVNVSNQSAHSMAPITAVGTEDRIHLAWMNASEGSFDILYSEWNGGKWSAPINVSDNETPSVYPTVAVDSMGRCHLSWMDIAGERNFDVFYSRRTGESWTKPINISSKSGTSQRPQIDIDTAGVAHIIWLDNQGGFFQLLHSQYVDNKWSDPVNTKLVDWFVTNDPDFSWKPCIDADNAGAIHVAWIGIDSDDSRYAATKSVRHSRWDGNAWSKPDNASRERGMAPNLDTTSLAVDSSGNIHLVWQDRGSAWYCSFDGGKWSEAVKLNQPDSEAAEPFVSSSRTGQLNFTWFERVSQDETKIIFRQLISGAWSKRIDVSKATLNGHGCTSVVDSNGIAHIVWSDIRSDIYEVYHRRIVPSR